MPAGGTMIVTEYWPLDVFRPGLLSNVWSLRQIGHCMAELQLLFPWWDIKVCHATTDTPFNENSRSSQFNIAKTIRLDWPNIICMRSLLQHKTCHFLLPAGGAMTITEYGHVFRTGLLSNIKHLIKVWRRSDIVCLNYNNFLFHGETLKFVRPPWTRPSTKTQDLHNLTSQRALD